MPAVPRVDRIKTIYSSAKALNYGWRFTDFLKTPMYNGVSRYVPQLHRITFRFCKQSEHSVGMRNFIEQKLNNYGAANPSVVVYSQPVRNTTPVIRAEYGNGRIVQIHAKNLSAADIEKDVELLYSRSGEPVVKLESRQTAAVPSVQGEWTPVTWSSPKNNLPFDGSTDPDLTSHRSVKPSVTSYLLENSRP